MYVLWDPQIEVWFHQLESTLEDKRKDCEQTTADLFLERSKHAETCKELSDTYKFIEQV